MGADVLTAERILLATEEVLRRYGPGKATVVDVAKVLGVSHGSVYRHFRTKAALREAVTARWLNQAEGELADVAAAEGPAADRLRRWLATLFEAKRRKAGGDPELFATYMVLVGEHSTLVDRHIETATGQLAGIIAEGIAGGEFRATDATAAARAVWDATDRFHAPAHAADWLRPDIDAAFEAVTELVLRGLLP